MATKQTTNSKRTNKAPARKPRGRSQAPAQAPAPARDVVALQREVQQALAQARAHRETAALAQAQAAAARAALRELAPQHGRGRPSIYAGKRIVAVCGKANPRQHGTAGWHAMAFVMAGGKRGVTWEALRDHMLGLGAQGVRNTSPGQHVAWDVAHGNAVLR